MFLLENRIVSTDAKIVLGRISGNTHRMYPCESRRTTTLPLYSCRKSFQYISRMLVKCINPTRDLICEPSYVKTPIEIKALGICVEEKLETQKISL